MKKLAIALIRFYQKYISAYTPPKCKYYPTCSNYTLKAIERFGFIKGGILGAWRFLRCNPFAKGGIDHVPEMFRLSFKNNDKH